MGEGAEVQDGLEAVGGAVVAAGVEQGVADAFTAATDGDFKGDDAVAGGDAAVVEEGEVVEGVVLRCVDFLGGGDEVDGRCVAEAFGDGTEKVRSLPSLKLTRVEGPDEAPGVMPTTAAPMLTWAQERVMPPSGVRVIWKVWGWPKPELVYSRTRSQVTVKRVGERRTRTPSPEAEGSRSAKRPAMRGGPALKRPRLRELVLRSPSPKVRLPSELRWILL